MVAKCPAANTAAVEQEAFWDGEWTPHKVGWLIAGASAAITCLIALITILGHARNYNRPMEQRQIIRVLLFPPVYGVISFISYRFFRAYTYAELGEAAYEAFAIAAFLMLMLQYIGTNVNEQRSVFAQKNKKPLPLPFCCWRYRPGKPYFLVLLKWSVVQYCFVRPALSIAGVVTEYYEVYCSSSLSYKYAYVYLAAIDFVSISVALYGLIVLYVLVKEDLKGRRPLAKFSTIKIGIFLVFYQGFIFSLLASHGVLHANEYWTTTNIADGLNALCTCVEMVLISAMQMWAFNWREYHIDRVDKPNGKGDEKGRTRILPSLGHAANFTDLLVESWQECKFLWDRMRGKQYTRRDAWMDFVQVFGAEDDDEDSHEAKREAMRSNRDSLYQPPVSVARPARKQRGGDEYTRSGLAEQGEAMRSGHSLLQPEQPSGYPSLAHAQMSAGGGGIGSRVGSDGVGGSYSAYQPPRRNSNRPSAQYGQTRPTQQPPRRNSNRASAQYGADRPRSWEPQAM